MCSAADLAAGGRGLLALARTWTPRRVRIVLGSYCGSSFLVRNRDHGLGYRVSRNQEELHMAAPYRRRQLAGCNEPGHHRYLFD